MVAGSRGILEAIEVKKRGGELSQATIEEAVDGYTAGEIPDYQMSALLMAILLKGMNYGETLAMTRAMAYSGKHYSFPGCADKHSTGGVGDKVSLTALPVIAACGLPVAKLSGRGLGTTGGTVDKLESIPGFSCALTEDRFRSQVEEVGIAIGEAGEVAPADRAIYALRDATATVDSLPLIASSIVSKKVATGAEFLLYDVKCGSGAFMRSVEDARELAGTLVWLSGQFGISASAIITGMDEPLGSAVGNALEVREAVRFLKGEEVREDLSETAETVASRLLSLAGREEPGRDVERAISSGAAYETFLRLVAAQGGDPSALDTLPVSGEVEAVRAPRDGYVARLDAHLVGEAALLLGAGRQRKGDDVDPGVGVEVLVRVGDGVDSGREVALLYHRGGRGLEEARRRLVRSIGISDEPPRPLPAILEGP